MGMREKLIELIRQNPNCIDMGIKGCSECQYGNVGDCFTELLVDHLMANNVVTVVRCKDCKQYNGHRYCTYFAETVLDDDFCSYGERRNDV